jgi:hypothetical protein
VKYGKLALGVALVAAGGFLAWRELERDKAQGVLATQAHIFPIPTQKVERISLISEGRHATWARGTDGAWTLLEGSEGARDDMAAEVISAWGRIRYQADVEAQPSDWARYGLDQPVVDMRATLKADPSQPDLDRERSLQIGNLAQTEYCFYGRIDGRERVVLISPDAGDLILGVGREAFGLESLVKSGPAR